MARSIPTYERRFIADGIQSAPNASSNVSASSPVATGLSNLGQAIGGVANVLQDEAREKRENMAAVDVSNVLSQGDVYWQEQGTRAMQQWKVGDPDIREKIGTDFDKWMNDSEAKLPTDKSRQYFRKQAVSMKSRLQQNAFTYVENATTAKLNADSDAGMQADENVVFGDASRVDEVYARRVEPLLARTDISEAEKIKAANKFKRGLYVAAERGEMERDPVGWYRRRFGDDLIPGVTPAAGSGGSAAGFDSVMQRIFKHEGGYTASDGNSGAPANFGINQRANPDIDVKNLTKEKAAAIYKERYWDKIRGDNLPPSLRGTAMDAAVNQGPVLANRWVQESGGDPVKFNALRREHYERLLEEPKNQRYRKAWLGRLGSYEADAAGGGAAPVPGVTRSSQPDALPDAPKTFSGMDYEQQLALKSMAETRLKQQATVARAQTETAVRDATAMHRDGIVEPQPLAPERFSVFGADGPKMYEEYQKSRQMGADIAGFKTQSEAEIQAALTISTPQPGEGYASADARQAIRVQAAQQVLQQRATDPAGYVVKNSASLKKQREVIDDPSTPDDRRPAMVQKYVAESIAEQQRLGIAAPKILTPGQSDAIARRAMLAAKPEDSANLISGLEQEYGRFFPQVFNQLVAEKKIAGELLIIPNLPSPAAREMVSRLARVKESDLTQGLDNDVQKSVKEETVATMGEFSKTIPFMTEQAASTVNAYETTMRKLAFSLTQTGMKPVEAADKASEMLLGHYTFEDTARIPLGVDVRKVMRGGDFMLKNDLKGIDTPPDVAGNRTPEQAASEWQDTVRARPQWFTSEDDGGLQLFATGANGVRYRVTRGGKPVSYTWANLAGRVSTNSGRVSTGVVQDMTGTR